jgi:AraC family transcriptional regulator
MQKSPVSVIFMMVLFLGLTVHAASIDNIEVINVEPFGYCCIHKQGPFTEIVSAINELWQQMQQQQIMPTGTMLGIFYNAPADVKPEELDWEIGFPVTNVNPQPPLLSKIWDFSTVAKTVHTGPFENTGETFEKVFQWMEANGYEQDGPVLERYLTMPGPDIDPSSMKAEIWVPVKKK